MGCTGTWKAEVADTVTTCGYVRTRLPVRVKLLYTQPPRYFSLLSRAVHFEFEGRRNSTSVYTGQLTYRIDSEDSDLCVPLPFNLFLST